jgi:flagellar brake protein
MTAAALSQLSSMDIERYLVYSRPEIVSILRDVLARRALITVVFGNGSSITSTLLRVNPDFEELVFEFGVDEEVNRLLLNAQSLTITTFIEQVKVQFSSPRAEATTHEGTRAVRVRIPDAVLRLQRREYFRLVPPVTRPLKCAPGLLDQTGKVVEFKITDISCGGIGLVATSIQPKLEIGQELANCRIDLHDVGVVTTDLVVCSVIEVRGHPQQNGLRCGCKFVRMPGTSVNMVQRYINKIERERRARA